MVAGIPREARQDKLAVPGQARGSRETAAVIDVLEAHPRRQGVAGPNSVLGVKELDYLGPGERVV